MSTLQGSCRLMPGRHKTVSTIKQNKDWLLVLETFPCTQDFASASDRARHVFETGVTHGSRKSANNYCNRSIYTAVYHHHH